MENFFAVLHVLIAVALILVILVQDPKGGSAGLFGGGGGSNSIFGATGTPTLLSKFTRYLGVAFAVTCIGLSLNSCQQGSVTDRALLNNTLTVQQTPETTEADAPGAQEAPEATTESQD
jgi:preprotein translocase subunit SecG